MCKVKSPGAEGGLGWDLEGLQALAGTLMLLMLQRCMSR